MRRGLTILLLLFFSLLASAQERLSIGLNTFQKAKKMQFEILEGGYNLFTESKHIKSLNKGDVFVVHFYEAKILIQKEGNIFVPGQMLNLVAHDSLGKFSVHAIKAKIQYPYYGDLSIESDTVGKRWINKLSIEDYLPGVLRAEVNGMMNLEFLKVMAVISRTYSLKNRGKHKEHGYDLCETTHCQVYEGAKNINELFYEAVNETENIVVIGSNYRMIDAVYHSNSGGLSSPAEYVWNKQISYLETVVDPFSDCGRKTYWEKVISKNEWDIFLVDNKFDLPDSLCLDDKLQRRQFLVEGDSILKMSDVRASFDLQSSLFEIKAIDTTILFCGNGYGHGVGLSQEGAYEMGLQDYNYETIIKYYYKNISLMHLDTLNSRVDSIKKNN